MPLGLMALVTVVMHMVSAQERGSSILRQGDVQNIQSEIVTSRTRAFLSCESGDMVVKVNFTQPFRGLMYAFRSRSTPCRIHGSGGLYYVLRIPLKGCGTWQESPRVFVNNITIRFHPALELEEDETKTLVCRYPPPLTPPPGSIHVVEQITLPPKDSTQIARARLSEVEILIIICLLLFLSLLTLGIGIAYFCLKRKNIQLVRRKTVSSAPASQLTKLSSSTPPQQSLLSGAILGHTVRIPRAVPYSASLRTYTMSDHSYGLAASSPEISRDSLESSPATSTTSGESADGTHLLHFNANRFTSALTIPKAVLRKDDVKRKTLPSVHKAQSVSPTTSSSSGELEDQIVTTVLDPEYSDNGNHYNFITRRNKFRSSTIPVYAQVDKTKQRVRIVEDAHVIHPRDGNREKMENESTGMQKQISSCLTSTKGKSKTSQPLSATNISECAKPSLNKSDETLERRKIRQPFSNSKISSEATQNFTTDGLEQRLTAEELHRDSKHLRIQDISEVYVTTTVETESTEIRTTVSRNIIEEHVKDTKESHSADDGAETPVSSKDEKNGAVDSNVSKNEPAKINIKSNIPATSQTSQATESVESTFNDLKNSKISDDFSRSGNHSDVSLISKPAEQWNVIIRQRKPLKNEEEREDDVEPSREPDLPSVPRFDVRIRSLPPEKPTNEEKIPGLDRRDSTELVDVPQLQMPHSIEKIRGIIAQLDTRRSEPLSAEKYTEKKIESTGNSGATARQSKTVSWPETPGPIVAVYSPEPPDGVSGSDSLASKSSLRERSSSEVLEKAPTLLNQPDSDNPGLERSTSEIIADRRQYSKWSKDVPVFEAYSPEFLENIPVVTQGGFFHSTYSADAKERTANVKRNE